MSDDAHEDHKSHKNVYFNVFCALCVFTAISVAADLFDLRRQYLLLAAIVLTVAVAKALCVMMFFMHLKFERPWKYVILTPTVLLAFALPLSLRPDIGETYYPADVPQQHDYAEQQAAKEHDGGHH